MESDDNDNKRDRENESSQQPIQKKNNRKKKRNTLSWTTPPLTPQRIGDMSSSLTSSCLDASPLTRQRIGDMSSSLPSSCFDTLPRTPQRIVNIGSSFTYSLFGNRPRTPELIRAISSSSTISLFGALPTTPQQSATMSSSLESSSFVTPPLTPLGDMRSSSRSSYFDNLPQTSQPLTQNSQQSATMSSSLESSSFVTPPLTPQGIETNSSVVTPLPLTEMTEEHRQQLLMAPRRVVSHSIFNNYEYVSMSRLLERCTDTPPLLAPDNNLHNRITPQKRLKNNNRDDFIIRRRNIGRMRALNLNFADGIHIRANNRDLILGFGNDNRTRRAALGDHLANIETANLRNLRNNNHR